MSNSPVRVGSDQAGCNATINLPDDGQIIALTDAGTGWQLKISPDTGARYVWRSHEQHCRTCAALQQDRSGPLGVYDASARKLDIYFNGTLDNGVLSGSIPAAQLLPALPATIGKRSGARLHWHGRQPAGLAYRFALRPC